MLTKWYNVAYATPFKTDSFECCETTQPENDEQLLEILAQLAIGDFRGAFITYFTNQLVQLGQQQGRAFMRQFDQEVDRAIRDAF